MSHKSKKVTAILLCFLLIFEQSVFAQSIDLSAHFANFGRSIVQSDKFRPLHLRYLGYDNLSQDFKILLDKGDTKKEDLENKAYLEENTQTLLKYFFVGLALPNEKFWVNLRPDSPENILDPDLEKTDIGRIFLEADLQLKKDTASFTSPQTPEGKAYWDKLYQKAGELFGTENITIPTITRPWIVPNEIIIRESLDDAYIYKATLKVMLEEDYLQGHTYEVREPHLVGVESVYSFSDPRLKELNQYSTQLIKDLIIPKLTYEVNTSKRYAPLRQVYYSLILAQWFKQRFKGRFSESSSLFGRTVPDIDSRDLTNLTSQEPYDKQTYFRQYQKSFKDGEYNLNEQVSTPFGQSIRRYMSGGLKLDNIANVSFGGIMVVGSPMIASIPTASFVSSSLKVNNLEISSNLGIKEAQSSVSVSPLETKDGKKGGIVGSPWEETMTDPNKHDKKNFRYLVYTINRYYGKGSFVEPSVSGEKAVEYIDPLTRLKGIKERKFISTSLIDKRQQNTLGWVGLILKVPEDNILAAEPRDWQTVTRKETVEEMYSQKDRNGIRSPDEILEMTDSRDYNEIVITGTGRRGKSVEIIGVLIRVNASTDKPLEPGLSRRLKTLALRKGWPIIEIREYLGSFKDTEPIIGIDGLAFNRDGKRYLFQPTEEDLSIVDEDKNVRPMTSVERSKVVEILREFSRNNPNPLYGELLKKIVAIPDKKLDSIHMEWKAAEGVYYDIMGFVLEKLGGGEKGFTLKEQDSYGRIRIFDKMDKQIMVGSRSYRGEVEILVVKSVNADEYLQVIKEVCKTKGFDFEVKSMPSPYTSEVTITPNTKGSFSSPIQESLGGIDLTRLPIVTQAITNLGSSPLKPSSYLSLRQLNLSQEYQAIESLASSGITPSPERLKSFLQASCLQENIGEDKDKAIGLLSDVLRDEESSLRPTDPGLRDILVVIESSTSPQQLKEIFLGKIN